MRSRRRRSSGRRSSSGSSASSRPRCGCRSGGRPPCRGTGPRSRCAYRQATTRAPGPRPGIAIVPCSMKCVFAGDDRRLPSGVVGCRGTRGCRGGRGGRGSRASARPRRHHARRHERRPTTSHQPHAGGKEQPPFHGRSAGCTTRTKLGAHNNGRAPECAAAPPSPEPRHALCERARSEAVDLPDRAG